MQTIRSTRGFTLLEFVVVIALAAVIMASVAALINKGSDSGAFNSTNDDLKLIITGLSEIKALKKTLPLQGGATFPAGCNSYISADIRSRYGYQCSTTITYIYTPEFKSVEQSLAVYTKLVDAGICSSAYPHTGGTRFWCRLGVFDGTNCQ